MAADKDFLGIKRRPAKGTRRNEKRLPRRVRAVDLVHGVFSSGSAQGEEGTAVEAAAFPHPLRLAGHAAVKTDDLHGRTGGGMGDGVHHVMPAESVRDFHAEVAAHELAEVGLVVQRVAAFAIGIESLHLTLRTLAGCPHEEQRLALAVGVGNGGQSADAAHVGIRVLGEVENFLPTRAFAVDAAEDGRPLGKVQGVIGLGNAQRAREEAALFQKRKLHVPIPADARGLARIVHTADDAGIAEQQEDAVDAGHTIAVHLQIAWHPAHSTRIGAMAHESVMPFARSIIAYPG